MILKNILIVDHVTGNSGRYSFGSGANLLISQSNTQGKSSLLKTIYHGLGFKINKFPTDWDAPKMSVKLDMYNERTKQDIYIVRTGDVYFVSGHKNSLSTAEYTRWLSVQLNIDLKLIDKNLNKVTSVVYPSAILTPFYVDQDDSWSGRLFSSTNELTMYKEVPERIFEYLLGISDDEELRLNELMSGKKNLLSATKSKRDSINEAFMDYINDLPEETPDSISTLKNIEETNKKNVDNLLELMNIANKKYIRHKAIRLKLQRNYDQSRKTSEEYRSILKMYEEDFKFIKTICKHCKSELTKEQVDTRMDITSNIYQLKVMIATCDKEIVSIEKKLSLAASTEEGAFEEYTKLSNEVESVPEIKSITEYIDIASKKRSQEEFATVIQGLEGDMGKLTAELDELREELKELKKDTRKRTGEIKNRYADYITDLFMYMPKSNISKMEFKKFNANKSSGVTDNQTYLGVYLAYMRLVTEFGRYRLPISIDSFIKNETDEPNLDKMFEATEKYLWNQNGQSIFSIIQSNVDKYITDSDRYTKLVLGDRLLSKDNFQDHLEEIAGIIHVD